MVHNASTISRAMQNTSARMWHKTKKVRIELHLVVVIMTIWEHYIVHDIKLILINLFLLFL